MEDIELEKELEKDVDELAILFAEAIGRALSQRGKKTGIESFSLALIQIENNLMMG